MKRLREMIEEEGDGKKGRKIEKHGGKPVYMEKKKRKYERGGVKNEKMGKKGSGKGMENGKREEK